MAPDATNLVYKGHGNGRYVRPKQTSGNVHIKGQSSEEGGFGDERQFCFEDYEG